MSRLEVLPPRFNKNRGEPGWLWFRYQETCFGSDVRIPRLSRERFIMSIYSVQTE